jgi:hypothetical protein
LSLWFARPEARSTTSGLLNFIANQVYAWQVWLLESWYDADLQLMNESPDALWTYARLLSGANFGFWFLCGSLLPASVLATTVLMSTQPHDRQTLVKLGSASVLLPLAVLVAVWAAFKSPPFPSQCDLWPLLCVRPA